MSNFNDPLNFGAVLDDVSECPCSIPLLVAWMSAVGSQQQCHMCLQPLTHSTCRRVAFASAVELSTCASCPSCVSLTDLMLHPCLHNEDPPGTLLSRGSCHGCPPHAHTPVVQSCHTLVVQSCPTRGFKDVGAGCCPYPRNAPAVNITVGAPMCSACMPDAFFHPDPDTRCHPLGISSGHGGPHRPTRPHFGSSSTFRAWRLAGRWGFVGFT